MARRNSHRLLGLINDLLDLQKLKARKMSFHMARVLPAPIMDETLAGMVSLAEESDVALEGRIEGADDAWIRCDKGRLQQVLTNLLSNAIKFSPSGGVVTVTVALETVALETARTGLRDCGFRDWDVGQ